MRNLAISFPVIFSILLFALCISIAHAGVTCTLLYNGTHLCIPSITKLFNITYEDYNYVVYWINESCLYIAVYHGAEYSEGTFSLYGLLSNNTLVYVTTVDVSGYSYICNNTFGKYSGIAIVFKTPRGELVGPILVLKPNPVPFPPIPHTLAVWTPLIALAFVIYIALYFNLRKLLAGVMAFAAFSIFLVGLFLHNPLLTGLMPVICIIAAAFLWWLLQKFPESGE